MRVLLYDAESETYFQSQAAWTPDATQAMDLHGTVQAVKVAYEHKLKSAEIILAFDEMHLDDMRLPLRVDRPLAREG